MTYVLVRPLWLPDPGLATLRQRAVAAPEGRLGLGEVASDFEVLVSHAQLACLEEVLILGRPLLCGRRRLLLGGSEEAAVAGARLASVGAEALVLCRGLGTPEGELALPLGRDGSGHGLRSAA